LGWLVLRPPHSWTGNEPTSRNPSGVPILDSFTVPSAPKATDLARSYRSRAPPPYARVAAIRNLAGASAFRNVKVTTTAALRIAGSFHTLKLRQVAHERALGMLAYGCNDRAHRTRYLLALRLPRNLADLFNKTPVSSRWQLIASASHLRAVPQRGFCPSWFTRRWGRSSFKR
jgi:hypothetical protein